MEKLTAGSQMPDFTYETPLKKGKTLSEAVSRGLGNTAVIFLRYYGCTLCQYDIHQYLVKYEEIRKVKGQIMVVLQSDAHLLEEQLKSEELPFEIICDPAQKLYRQFGIKPAASKEDMLGPNTMKKIESAREEGFSHGEYEGEELQLPAVFVIDRDRRVIRAHYGRSVDDVPSPETLSDWLKEQGDF